MATVHKNLLTARSTLSMAVATSSVVLVSWCLLQFDRLCNCRCVSLLACRFPETKLLFLGMPLSSQFLGGLHVLFVSLVLEVLSVVQFLILLVPYRHLEIKTTHLSRRKMAEYRQLFYYLTAIYHC